MTVSQSRPRRLQSCYIPVTRRKINSKQVTLVRSKLSNFQLDSLHPNTHPLREVQDLRRERVSIDNSQLTEQELLTCLQTPSASERLKTGPCRAILDCTVKCGGFVEDREGSVSCCNRIMALANDML